MIGQQVFDAGGQRWTLFLGNAAQCAVEEQYDKGFFAVVSDAMPGVDAETAIAVAQSMSEGIPLPPDVAERAAAALRGMRLSVLRDLAHAGLTKHHPGITPDQVSDLIDELGHQQFGEIMRRAIEAAQGKGADDDVAPGKPRSRGTRRSGPTGQP